MKLYTSYWAQLRNFPKNLVGLSTCVWNPKYIQPGRDKCGAIWLDCPPLKPGSSCNGLCRGSCEPKHPQNCVFLKEYRKQLDYIDTNVFLAQLRMLKARIEKGEGLDDVNFAFLVYESPTNACSERIVIQQWLKDNGVEINEWKKGVE